MAAAGLDVPPHLRVDGGMVANDWLCQNLADMCDCPIDRPAITETTALGAAMLAMLHIGWFDNLESFGRQLGAAKRSSSRPWMGAKRAEKQRNWQSACHKSRFA
jgi:glycerol kinase